MKKGGVVKSQGSSAEDGRRRRWQRHRQRRREEIVAAAVEAINTHGAGIGMNDIAYAAGVSKPVLYRHFTDQAALNQAIGRHAAQWLISLLAEQLEYVAGADPAEVISAVVNAYLEAIETQPQLYRFVIRYAFNDPGDDIAEGGTVEGYRDVVVRHVHEVLSLRLEETGYGSQPALPWALGIVGMVQNVGEWWLENPDQATRAELTAHLTTLLWAGLAEPLTDPSSLE